MQANTLSLSYIPTPHDYFVCVCVCVGTCVYVCACVGQGNLGCCSSGVLFEMGVFIGLELAVEARLASWYIPGISQGSAYLFL